MSIVEVMNVYVTSQKECVDDKEISHGGQSINVYCQ